MNTTASTITGTAAILGTTATVSSTASTITTEPYDGESPHIGIKKKVFILVFATLSFIENTILLVAILTNQKLRKKVTFIFVINLLFSQMLVAVVTLPMYCFATNHFLFGYVLALTIIAYILNLCTVTLERYLAICRPYIYCTLVSSSKTVKYSLACWVVSFIIQILPIFWKNSKKEILIHRIYLGFTLFLFIIVPLFIVWFCNAFICFEIVKLKKNQQHGIGQLEVPATIEETNSLSESMNSNSNALVNRVDRQHNRKGRFNTNNNNNNGRNSSKLKRTLQKSHKEIQLALVFVIAAIAYNITWIPVIIMTFLQVIDRMDLEPAHLSEISVFLLALNANLDPLIYGLFLRPLRSHLAKTGARLYNETCIYICCRENRTQRYGKSKIVEL